MRIIKLFVILQNKINYINNLKLYNKMKKVFLTLAVMATVACFSSCSKNCTCTKWLNGEKKGTEEFSKEKLKEGQKCSDYSTVIEINDKKTGLECR